MRSTGRVSDLDRLSADLDPTYISGIERGVRNPSVLSIVRIAKALGIDASNLFEGVKA